MRHYRHGPIAIASTRSLVWILGEAPRGLAAAEGLDPDRPHNLQRSVILPAAP